MKLVPHVVPTKLTKVDKFSNGLPTDFGPMAKLIRTLKEAIWSGRNVDTQIRDNGLDRMEVGEKMKFEGSSRSKKKNKFS